MSATPQHFGITFIGGGNMAQALIQGLLSKGVYSRAQLSVAEIDVDVCAQLRNRWGIVAQPRLEHYHDFIVLAVKPQVMASVVTQLAKDLVKDLTDRQQHSSTPLLVLSIAAGITLSRLSDWFASATSSKGGADVRLVRSMPNTPALVGHGVTAVYAPEEVGQHDRERVQALLQSVGQCIWLADEKSLDAVTAISGSGPAYVFYFLEAMQQAGERLGLDRGVARQLAQATFIGAGHLAGQSSEELSQLRARVTSKGGTTAAALAVLDDHQVAQCFMEALFAAAARSEELSRT